MEKAEDTYVYHLLALDDALEQGSDLKVSDIESESDHESETESSDDDRLQSLDRQYTGYKHSCIHWTTAWTHTLILQANKNELDFLNLLFPEELYSLVLEVTNLYAQLCIRTKANSGWYDTTPEEMRAFLGCLIVMGIVCAPAQDLYWSKDKLFHLSCIEERFSRTRFENIQRYFHVANTTQNPPRNQPGHDKLVHV